MWNGQKPRCSSCIVIELHNFKIMLFLLHGYHTLQLKNIAVPAIDFSPHNFKILPTCHMEFFWVINPNQFFLETGRNYVSIIITIISNITVLVSNSVFCFGCFMPMSHGVNKKAPPIVSPPPLLFTRFSSGSFVEMQAMI